jgi:hypothetical protein
MTQKKEWCGWGWNDQDPEFHSTNGHAAVAVSGRWVRLFTNRGDPTGIVVAVRLCAEHAEMISHGRLLTRR